MLTKLSGVVVILNMSVCFRATSDIQESLIFYCNHETVLYGSLTSESALPYDGIEPTQEACEIVCNFDNI
jgi:hypothetical protein